jgi:hypothetical protein
MRIALVTLAILAVVSVASVYSRTLAPVASVGGDSQVPATPPQGDEEEARRWELFEQEGLEPMPELPEAVDLDVLAKTGRRFNFGEADKSALRKTLNRAVAQAGPIELDERAAKEFVKTVLDEAQKEAYYLERKLEFMKFLMEMVDEESDQVRAVMLADDLNKLIGSRREAKKIPSPWDAPQGNQNP